MMGTADPWPDFPYNPSTGTLSVVFQLGMGLSMAYFGLFGLVSFLIRHKQATLLAWFDTQLCPWPFRWHIKSKTLGCS